MKLTAKKIDALKPGPERKLVSDGEGLYLEIRQNNERSWVYRYTLNGRKAKITLGRYPALTLKAARDERDRQASLVAQGKSPSEQRKLLRIAHTTEPTVREFGERWFVEIAKAYKNPVSVRRYLDKEIYPALGAKRMREVTAMDVQRIVYLKRDRGFPSAAAQLRDNLKRMFDYAVEVHAAEVNPAAQVAKKFITKARPRERRLTPDEIRIYLCILYESNVRRQFKLALHLILLTMVRKGELLLARWKDVDLNGRQWLIPETHTKTGKPHIVYLSTQAVALFQQLKDLAGDSALVLPGRSSTTQPFAGNALNKALEGITFPIDPFTIHDMRRTASTLLHEKDYPSDAIELALGHKIGGIRGTYNVAGYAEQRKRMLQWWGDYVDSLMNESKVIVGNFGSKMA